MASFEWSETLSVGVLKIDLHNQHLLGQLRKLGEAFTLHQDNFNLRFEMADLIEYTAFHRCLPKVLRRRT